MGWQGTWDGGLNKYDRSTKSFTALTIEDGLPDNTIYGLLEDNENNFWISTNMGLSEFNPTTGIFKNFNKKDGLQSNEFNTNAFFKSESGMMYLEGIKGLNYFNPMSISQFGTYPITHIDKFFVK